MMDSQKAINRSRACMHAVHEDKASHGARGKQPSFSE